MDGLAMARHMRTMSTVLIDEQRILLTQAAPGMVLARPVQLPNRTILCPRETVLNDELVLRLMARGIKRIYVRGTPLPGSHQLGFTQRMDRLSRSFSRVRSIEAMATLEKVVEHVLVRRA